MCVGGAGWSDFLQVQMTKHHGAEDGLAHQASSCGCVVSNGRISEEQRQRTRVDVPV